LVSDPSQEINLFIDRAATFLIELELILVSLGGHPVIFYFLEHFLSEQGEELVAIFGKWHPKVQAAAIHL